MRIIFLDMEEGKTLNGNMSLLHPKNKHGAKIENNQYFCISESTSTKSHVSSKQYISLASAKKEEEVARTSIFTF